MAKVYWAVYLTEDDLLGLSESDPRNLQEVWEDELEPNGKLYASYEGALAAIEAEHKDTFENAYEEAETRPTLVLDMSPFPEGNGWALVWNFGLDNLPDGVDPDDTFAHARIVECDLNP